MSASLVGLLLLRVMFVKYWVQR